MTALSDSYAVDYVLQNLKNSPHLSSYYGNYLCKTPLDDSVKQRIIIFLNSEYNIYNWQAMWLIRYLGRSTLCSDSRKLLRDVYNNRNNHDAYRALTASILGKKGEISDQRLLSDSYDSESSALLKRGIVCGLSEMIKPERNHFMKYHQHDSWSLKIACNAVLKLR